jgi:hypothetical protein
MVVDPAQDLGVDAGVGDPPMGEIGLPALVG